MDLEIFPKCISGTVRPPLSKSYIHRALIINYFIQKQSFYDLVDQLMDAESVLSDDVLCTIQVLKDLDQKKEPCKLFFNSSASTLRFFLPILAFLEKKCYLDAHDDLKSRPLDAYNHIFGQVALPTWFDNTLNETEYTIDSTLSSQYVSGLLLALCFRNTYAKLTLSKSLSSAPYVFITLDLLKRAGFKLEFKKDSSSEFFEIYPSSKRKALDIKDIETDWSQAAFWLVANVLGASIKVEGLNSNSIQGDSCLSSIITAITTSQAPVIDLIETPDLFPVLAILAGYQKDKKTVFKNINRLKYKESDRIKATACMLKEFGVSSSYDGSIFSVYGVKSFKGSVIEPFNDHRIIMAGAIGALFAQSKSVIRQSEYVNKSYPGFFNELKRLGVRVENR